jgi:intracellular multiplication protein IcmV
MAIRDIFKISRKTFVNPVAWIDFDTLRSQTRNLWDTLKSTFTAPQPLREETFEAAMKRLNITEKDVKFAANTYRIYAIFFVIFGLIVFCYAFYLLFSKVSFAGWLLGLSASALFFSQAFKFDFWALQMKERRLGLSFAEWKRHILGEKGTSS